MRKFKSLTSLAFDNIEQRTQRLEEENARPEQQSLLELEGVKSQLKEANRQLNTYQEQLHEVNQMLKTYQDREATPKHEEKTNNVTQGGELQAKTRTMTTLAHQTAGKRKEEKPANLLTARNLLRHVEADLPPLDPKEPAQWVKAAKQWTNTYCDWERDADGECLLVQVVHSLSTKKMPTLATALANIAERSKNIEQYLNNIQMHFQPLPTGLTAEMEFLAKATMKTSQILAGDYTEYIDELRQLACRCFPRLSETQKEKKVLNTFATTVKPEYVQQAVFVWCGERESETESVDLPDLLRIIDNAKRYAALVFASNIQRKRINVNMIGIENKPTRTMDNREEDNGIENRNNLIRLKDRTPQEKANYLRNYNWGRPLCPKAKVGQRCSDADFQRCTSIHRHLWTPAEKTVILSGAVPEGGPTMFSEDFLNFN